MYIVTPFPNYALRARPHQARRAAEVDVQAEAGRGRAGRRLLRRGQPRRAYSTTARSSSTRSTTTRSRVDAATGQRGLEHQARRHQQGRDHHHGAAGGQGQGAGRQQRRRVRRARLAHRARRRTGKIAWRAYNTGPDKDVLIGPTSSRSTRRYKGQDLGVATWPPEQWKIGGGTVWGWISYDPELEPDLSTAPATPGPGTPSQRPATTSGPPASSPATPTPARRSGSTRRARTTSTTTTASTSSSCSICRSTASRARCWSARSATATSTCSTARPARCSPPTRSATSTSSKGVDLKTGPPIAVDEKTPVTGKTVRDICPAAPGAKDWQPSAFSPRTGLLYIPHQNLCMDLEDTRGRATSPGTPYVGANVQMYAGPGGNRGEFTAWDPVDAARRPGASRRSSRSGAAPWSPRATSSSTARWRAGSRRSTRRHGRAAVAVQDRLRDHRPADHLPRARTASSTWPSSRASAAGPAPSWPAASIRATGRRRSGFVGATARPAERHHQGRDALCLRAAAALALAAAAACSPGAPVADAAPSELRVCADPNNLPFSNAKARGLREPDRRAARAATSACRVNYTWSRPAPRLRPQHAEARASATC